LIENPICDFPEHIPFGFLQYDHSKVRHKIQGTVAIATECDPPEFCNSLRAAAHDGGFTIPGYLAVQLREGMVPGCA